MECEFTLKHVRDMTRAYSHTWKVITNRVLSSLTNRKYSTALTCGSFSEKTLKKSTCVAMIRINYYFWKSNIPVINLVIDSRNMIKV